MIPEHVVPPLDYDELSVHLTGHLIHHTTQGFFLSRPENGMSLVLAHNKMTGNPKCLLIARGTTNYIAPVVLELLEPLIVKEVEGQTMPDGTSMCPEKVVSGNMTPLQTHTERKRKVPAEWEKRVVSKRKKLDVAPGCSSSSMTRQLEMPPVHVGDNLTDKQILENKRVNLPVLDVDPNPTIQKKTHESKRKTVLLSKF